MSRNEFRKCTTVKVVYFFYMVDSVYFEAVAFAKYK